jgi:hypothetical protein
LHCIRVLSRKAEKENEMKYVIERMSDLTREWWTGEGWSEIDTDACWYSDPDEAEADAECIGGSVTGFDI